MNPTTSIQSECPQCGTEIILSAGTEKNEIVICPDCQSDLEVVNIIEGQAQLQLAPEEEEDWGE